MPGASSNRFVEVEVELREGSPRGSTRSRTSSPRRAPSLATGTPKLFRALGRDVRTDDPSPRRRSRRCEAGCASSFARSSGTIRAHGSAAIPRASTTCASASAACAPCSAPEASSSRPTPPSSTRGCKQLGRCSATCATSTCCSRVSTARRPSSAARTRERHGRCSRACAPERSAQPEPPAGALAVGRATSRSSTTPPGRSTSSSRADPAATLDELADEASERLRKAVRKLPDEPADEELHAVRKKGKRARYAAELAGRQRLVKRAKKLQDVLGEHQDAVVAAERLRELAAEAAPEQALAAGRLVEREEERRAGGAGRVAEGVAEARARRSDRRPRRRRARRARRQGAARAPAEVRRLDVPEGQVRRRRDGRGVRAARGRGGDGAALRAPGGDRRDEYTRREGPAEGRPLLADARRWTGSSRRTTRSTRSAGRRRRARRAAQLVADLPLLEQL